MKTLYFDCFSGASGDMIVGALIDLGAELTAIQRAIDSLGLIGCRLTAERVNKNGVAATQFTVSVDPDTPQPHRHLKHIIEIVQQGDFPEAVKHAAAETFHRIADCEARIHGITPERVHFHEVGAVDSIVDVVGAHFALHLLKVDVVHASALNLGSGTVECAHGVMPVPAPATALLLEGVPSYGSSVQAELVTPTGAALIAQIATRFGTMPTMRVRSVGHGSGTRDLPDRPNVLRVILGETEGSPGSEPIAIIESNLDDMSPELLAVLLADLIEAGARDAFISSVTGKKGRPGHLITVLCDDDKIPDLASLLFRGSTTFGLRIRREERICLDREWRSVETSWGAVRVKIGRLEGLQTIVAPEFDDCRQRAREAAVSTRAVYEAALAAAFQGQWVDEEERA